MPGGATTPRTCGTEGTSKPASLSVGASGKPARRFSLTCASTRMLPARICSPASEGSITIMLTWPPRSAEMRSPPPGKEMKAQRAPLDFCRSWRTTLSRLVTEPPDCLLAGVLFRHGDEIAERLVRRVGLHRNHRGLEHQPRDRCQIAQRHFGLGGGDRAGQPHAGEKTDRMGIALLLEKVGGSQSGTTAGLVHDLHAHWRELLLLDYQHRRAREQIAAAAGAGVHHHLDRARRRESLRLRRDQRRDQCRKYFH